MGSAGLSRWTEAWPHPQRCLYFYATLQVYGGILLEAEYAIQVIHVRSKEPTVSGSSDTPQWMTVHSRKVLNALFVKNFLS